MHRAMNQPSVIISGTCWLLVITSQAGHILLFTPYNLCFFGIICSLIVQHLPAALEMGRWFLFCLVFFNRHSSLVVAVAALMWWQCRLIFCCHEKFLFFRDGNRGHSRALGCARFSMTQARVALSCDSADLFSDCCPDWKNKQSTCVFMQWPPQVTVTFHHCSTIICQWQQCLGGPGFLMAKLWLAPLIVGFLQCIVQ